MAKFKAGDICRVVFVVDKERFGHLVGEQVTIRTFQFCPNHMLGPGFYYTTDARSSIDMEQFAPREDQLTIDRPPDVGSWSLIEKITGWNPTKVPA